jgi:nucleoside transporter
MFLQFAVFGAFAPIMGRHLALLNFTPFQIGAVYSSIALATLLTILVAGEIADRWWPAEKVLSLSHFAAGALVFLAGRVTAADPARFPKMWACIFGAMLFYGPAAALGNAISFRHLADPGRDFHRVRVFGTLGWIAAGAGVSGWMSLTGRPLGDSFTLGAGSALLNGFYCLTLPSTPPHRGSPRRFALAGALGMLKDPSFALLTFLSFSLSAFATFAYFRISEFYPLVGIKDRFLSLTLASGQATEVLALFSLPWFLKRLGTRTTIAVGMSLWVLRFVLLAQGSPPALMVAAQALHGFCFTLVFVAAQLYIERISPPDARASAQGLHGLVTSGLGLFAGGYLGGWILQKCPLADRWTPFWATAAAACAGILFVFLLGFRAREGSRASTGATSPPPPVPPPPPREA